MTAIAEFSRRAFILLSISLFPTYIVLLLVCLYSLAAFIFRFFLIRYERTPSIFNRNKSGPSPSNPTTTRTILQAYKYYHHPLSCSGSLRIFLAFPAICLNPFTWFSIPWPLSFMQPRMHECTSAQSFAAVNDIRMPVLPMYLVTLLRSLHFAFILHLAAVFPWYFWISLPIEIVSRLIIFKKPSGVILSKNWKIKR